jgi:hypothetical protein
LIDYHLKNSIPNAQKKAGWFSVSPFELAHHSMSGTTVIGDLWNYVGIIFTKQKFVTSPNGEVRDFLRILSDNWF